MKPTERMLQSIKKSIPDATLEKYLGSGEFGVVHKAVLLEKTGKINVAIKTYDISIIRTTKPHQLKIIVDKINDEISSLKTLVSPSVIKIYKVVHDEQGEIIHLVLEFCEGGDLDQALSKRKTGYPESQVKIWLKDLAEGFLLLDSHKIIHRDIKPANLLLNGGKIVIADFGVSKFGHLGVTFTRCGSPLFAAPEVLLHLGHNTKADVWSLGVTIYMLLYGKDPWNCWNGFTRQPLNGDILDKKIYSGDRLSFPSDPPIESSLKNLLKRMIVFEQEDRISWQGILDSPYLKDFFSSAAVSGFVDTENQIPATKNASKTFNFASQNNSEHPVKAGNGTLLIDSDVSEAVGLSTAMLHQNPVGFFHNPPDKQTPEKTASSYFTYLCNCVKFFLETGVAFEYCQNHPDVYHTDIWKRMGLLGAIVNKVNLELVKNSLFEIESKAQPKSIETIIVAYYNNPDLGKYKQKLLDYKPRVDKALKNSIDFMQKNYVGNTVAWTLVALQSPGFTESSAAAKLANKEAHVLSIEASKMNQKGLLRDDTFFHVKQALGRVYLCLTYQNAMEFREKSSKKPFDWKAFLSKLNNEQDVDELYLTATDYCATHQ
jgi:serine/threonine protein kinase